MLATPWPAPFDDPGWIFELKWDGVRCLLSVDETVQLTSRAGNNMTARYPELAGLDLPPAIVLDGEIVALDDSGRPSFELLQSRMSTTPVGSSPVPVTYVAFDLLYDGESLLQVPLERRWERLSELLLPAPVVTADRFSGVSGPIWQFVLDRDLEGIVAKRLGSSYVPGNRSPDWRKIGNFKQVRAVVGGFTAGTGGRSSTYGALLLGLSDGDRLRWIGSVGSGFDDRSLRMIRSALDQMTVTESPFRPDSELPVGSTWVEPRLVAMVRFKQWTLSGRLRAPSFKGFTSDPADTVTFGSEGPEPR